MDSFLPCYGLAESTLIVTGGERQVGPTFGRFFAESIREGFVRDQSHDETQATSLISCGRPFFGQSVAVVDPETSELMPRKNIGEIWTHGPSVASGYWATSGDTGVFDGKILGDTSNRLFLRTGDLGFVDGNNLYVTGRRKDLMKIRGQNVFLKILKTLPPNRIHRCD